MKKEEENYLPGICRNDILTVSSENGDRIYRRVGVNKMYRACLFDLDGTLADTLESIADVSNQVLEHYGLERQPVDKFRYYAGDGAEVLMKRCFQDTGGRPEDLKEAQQMYKDIFAKDPLYRVTVFSGMKETLEILKKRGVKLAVCSNKPHLAVLGVIQGLFPKDFFDAVQGLEDGFRRKPYLDIPEKILRDLKVKAEECMYVGDTNTDMKTGKGAGMMTIGVLWGFRDRQELEENDADRIISRPEELLDIQEGCV